MKVQVLLPEKVFHEATAEEVIAEAADGSFGMLPRHIDFVAALVPGILTLRTGDRETFFAVDEGVLVKCGDVVTISVRHAVCGPDLGSLERTVREQYEIVDEREQEMRSAIARLEIDIMRRFVELKEPSP